MTVRRHRLNGSIDTETRIAETANVGALCAIINALATDGWTIVRADIRTQCEHCAKAGRCDGTPDTYSECTAWEALS